MIDDVLVGAEDPVRERVATPFGSSLLESYGPEAEHLSNGLGSAVSFKIPTFRYVADLNELFALARGWVIAKDVLSAPAQAEMHNFRGTK